MQLKNATLFTYEDSLTAVVFTEGYQEESEVVEAYEQDGGDVGSEESVDNTEMGKYFKFSEILEESAVIPSLLHSVILLCF